MMQRWRTYAKTIKGQLIYYKELAREPRTPKLSRWLIGMAIAYLVSPIDLIPDFIPVIGYLDDLIIVPCLVGLAMFFIPENVKTDVKIKINASKLP